MVLIIVDCLRRDVAENENIMPFLNKKFPYRNQAYTNAPSTAFAVPTILTGKLPFEATKKLGINQENIEYYLPKILDSEKIKTTLVTSNAFVTGFFGFNNFCHFYADFLHDETDRYIDESILVRFVKGFVSVIPKDNFLVGKLKPLYANFTGKFSKRVSMGKDKKISHQKVLNKLKESELGDKNFIFLHLMEPHRPYTTSENARKHRDKIKKITHKACFDIDLSKEELSFLKGMYIEECKEADKGIKNIFEYLKTKLDIENTLFIITSDHGEAFNETNYIGHPNDKLNNVKHHINVPFFSNKDLGKETIWSTDIYRLILKYTLDREIKKNKQVCIGYKAVDDDDVVKNNTHYPVAFFDFKTNKLLEKGEKLAEEDLPPELRGIIKL